jgi:ubiquinone/menaquinone biosynthesis C-methylase UbiE
VTGGLQDKITGFWSAVADGYEAHGGNVPARGSEEDQAWVRAMADLLPVAPADVLDVGTGTGFVAMIAAGLGHRVTAIDLAEPMLAIARDEARSRNVPVTFATGDAVRPAFPAATFDAIVSRHLIWTLRDIDGALKAWRHLLRPGGRVVAIDGFWFSSEPEGDEGFFESFYDRQARASLPGWRYHDPAPILALFEQAGFTRLSVRPLQEIHRAAAHKPSPQPSYALLGYAG